MRSHLFSLCLASLLIATASAQDSRDRATTGAGSASTAARRPATTAARGPLPDPVLLDGTTQPVEKKSENGMLGQFEIPGDENARGGKVGGQQMPPGAQGGGGGQPMPNMPQGGGGGMPPPGGMPQGAAGGASGQQMPAGAQAGGGGGAPGQQIPQGGMPGGGAPMDPSQANGQAGGMQVGELKPGDPDAVGGGGGGGEPTASKPQQVAIGDSAMQIKGVANASSIVGGVPAGNTQQFEKPVGGRGGGGSSDGRSGVEKGKVVPAGL